MAKLIVADGDWSMRRIRAEAARREPSSATATEKLTNEFRKLPLEVQRAAILFANRFKDAKPETMREVLQFIEIYPDVVPYMMTGEWFKKLIHQERSVLQGMMGTLALVDLMIGKGRRDDGTLQMPAGETEKLIRKLREINALVHRNVGFIISLQTILQQGEEKKEKLGGEELRNVLEKGSKTADETIPESLRAKTKISVPQDLPPIEVKPRKLMMVLTNMFSNALQAIADPASGLIEANAEKITIGGRDYVRILVKDTGTGIDEKDGSIGTLGYTTKSAGTGFGLAGSKMILREIGGTLELRNRKDRAKGAEVEILIPAAQ